jgi:hypothetical protein
MFVQYTKEHDVNESCRVLRCKQVDKCLCLELFQIGIQSFQCADDEMVKRTPYEILMRRVSLAIIAQL